MKRQYHIMEENTFYSVYIFVILLIEIRLLILGSKTLLASVMSKSCCPRLLNQVIGIYKHN